MKVKVPISAWRNPIHWFAIGFGSGASPKAPGTVGTLAAMVFYVPMSQLSPVNYIIFVSVAAIVGVWLCGRTARDWGVHDHSGIVWDEFVGYWITMIALPFDWGLALLGFALFRFFDIVKPWPISWIDRHVPGGVGIMADDIAAGLMSLFCLHVCHFYIF